MWITETFETISFYFLVKRLRRFGGYACEHWERLRKREGTFYPIIVWDFECVKEANGADGVRELRDTMRFARDLYYMNILFAANRRNDSMISEWADRAHFTKYITEIVVRKEKRLKDVYGIVKKYNANLAASFLVSSRLAPDIGFGNFLGFHTVWLQGGREPDQSFNFETRPEVILQTASDFRDLLERFAPHAQTGSLVGLVPIELLREATLSAAKQV